MAPIIRVGIIGCGLVTQVIHLPNLNLLSDYFTVTWLCDVSPGALEHCSQSVRNSVPKTTQDAATLCSSNEVDLVFVVNSDEYHCEHAVLALKHNKHVFVEKPMALCKRDANAIIAAESRSTGKVMVGYMRRYATAFTDAVNELFIADYLLDIIGNNSLFVDQSGMFPKAFNDYAPHITQEKDEKAASILSQAFAEARLSQLHESGPGNRMWRRLGGLQVSPIFSVAFRASHDLSAMREIVGVPASVLAASLGDHFWTVLFKYPCFTLLYESGIDRIPRFDAHIEVYSMTKSVRVQWDTPFIKGLPVTMHVSENIGGGLQERMVRKTYEDPYVLEMKALYDSVAHNKPVKTTAADAAHELELFGMIMRAALNS